jgi:hypothetical protein
VRLWIRFGGCFFRRFLIFFILSLHLKTETRKLTMSSQASRDRLGRHHALPRRRADQAPERDGAVLWARPGDIGSD